MVNPFKSKKFVYAVVYALVSTATALLPSILVWAGAEVDPATLDMVQSNLPYLFAAALFVLGGHALSDAISLAKGYQAPYEGVPLPERENVPQS